MFTNFTSIKKYNFDINSVNFGSISTYTAVADGVECKTLAVFPQSDGGQ